MSLTSLILPALAVNGQSIKGGFSLAVWIVFAVSATTTLVTTDLVLSRLNAPTASGLDAVFAYVEHGYLIVYVTNHAETLRDAGVTVLVPKVLTGPWWAGPDKTEHPRRGEGEWETNESLTGDGVGSNSWHAKGFHLLGGGSRTQLPWTVRGPTGTYPVRLKVYDDSTRPRRLIETGTFTIPPRETDPLQATHQLLTFTSELEHNRKWLFRALSKGRYPEIVSTTPKEDALILQNEATFNARFFHLDPETDHPELRTAVEDAYNECKRVSEACWTSAERGADLPVGDADKVERAMVSVLLALMKLRAFPKP